MKWIKASERLPGIGIYFALYNGDHCILQIHDGGFRVVFYDSSIQDVPNVNLIKWLDESEGENEAIAEVDYWKKRCEAAEMLIGKDVINRNDYDKEYELWQSLKSK